MATTVHYLAYGSNLHPLRLRERTPSATLMGTLHVATLALAFHKRSSDGSAKANIVEMEDSAHGVWTALYAMEQCDVIHLDRAEGLGNGYRKEQVSVAHAGDSYRAFTYIAESTHVDDLLVPFDWYVGLVAAGARYHGFPEAYIQAMERLAVAADPDPERAANHARLLRRIAVNDGVKAQR